MFSVRFYSPLVYLLALPLGCAGTLLHDFSSRDAHDYDCHCGGDPPVLLIPANTHLYTQQPEARASGPHLADASLATAREEYHGPARIFLWPGPHYYALSVTTSQGIADFDLNLPAKAGERYLLEITVTNDNVTTAVLKLTEASYQELYPPPGS